MPFNYSCISNHCLSGLMIDDDDDDDDDKSCNHDTADRYYGNEYQAFSIRQMLD